MLSRSRIGAFLARATIQSGKTITLWGGVRAATPAAACNSVTSAVRGAVTEGRRMLSTTHSSTSSSGNNTHRGDKLLLNGLVFHGYHGVYQHERETGQRFVVDLELSTNLIKAERSDDLNDTVDYGQVFKMVKGIMEGPPAALLEFAAGRIAQSILAQYATIDQVWIRIRKPHVRVAGTLDSLGIEVTRTRADYPELSTGKKKN